MIQSLAMFAKYLNDHRRFLETYLPLLGQNIPPLLEIISEKHAGMTNPTNKVHLALLEKLSETQPDLLKIYSESAVRINSKDEITQEAQAALKEIFLKFSPWRKGPFNLFGIEIDSEWRSNLKWDRILPHLPALQNRRILDVGCNSGYYMFRMNAYHPKCVLGIDPSPLFYLQFKLLQHYFQEDHLAFFPLKLDQIASVTAKMFDVIFCMGILYHQRSPLDCLAQLKTMMTPKATLILETLIWPGEDSIAFVPADRYAQMNNVYFLPTLNCLQNWIRQTGFKTSQCLDITETTCEEQRSTPWMTWQSLANFLDPTDAQKTIEGYPRPLRCILKIQA